MAKSILVPIGDVLTITTGVMLSDRGVVGLRGLMGFMTKVSNDLNDTSITDTGCMALEPMCRTELLRQHPALAAVDARFVTPDNVEEWLPLIIERHGTHIAVEQFR